MKGLLALSQFENEKLRTYLLNPLIKESIIGILHCPAFYHLTTPRETSPIVRLLDALNIKHPVLRGKAVRAYKLLNDGSSKHVASEGELQSLFTPLRKNTTLEEKRVTVFIDTLISCRKESPSLTQLLQTIMEKIETKTLNVEVDLIIEKIHAALTDIEIDINRGWSLSHELPVLSQVVEEKLLDTVATLLDDDPTPQVDIPRTATEDYLDLIKLARGVFADDQSQNANINESTQVWIQHFLFNAVTSGDIEFNEQDAEDSQIAHQNRVADKIMAALIAEIKGIDHHFVFLPFVSVAQSGKENFKAKLISVINRFQKKDLLAPPPALMSFEDTREALQALKKDILKEAISDQHVILEGLPLGEDDFDDEIFSQWCESLNECRYSPKNIGNFILVALAIKSIKRFHQGKPADIIATEFLEKVAITKEHAKDGISFNTYGQLIAYGQLTAQKWYVDYISSLSFDIPSPHFSILFEFNLSDCVYTADKFNFEQFIQHIAPFKLAGAIGNLYMEMTLAMAIKLGVAWGLKHLLLYNLELRFNFENNRTNAVHQLFEHPQLRNFLLLQSQEYIFIFIDACKAQGEQYHKPVLENLLIAACQYNRLDVVETPTLLDTLLELDFHVLAKSLYLADQYGHDDIVRMILGTHHHSLNSYLLRQIGKIRDSVDQHHNDDRDILEIFLKDHIQGLDLLGGIRDLMSAQMRDDRLAQASAQNSRLGLIQHFIYLLHRSNILNDLEIFPEILHTFEHGFHHQKPSLVCFAGQVILTLQIPCEKLFAHSQHPRASSLLLITAHSGHSENFKTILELASAQGILRNQLSLDKKDNVLSVRCCCINSKQNGVAAYQ